MIQSPDCITGQKQMEDCVSVFGVYCYFRREKTNITFCWHNSDCISECSSAAGEEFLKRPHQLHINT